MACAALDRPLFTPIPLRLARGLLTHMTEPRFVHEHHWRPDDRRPE
ncbi:hypothetical protein JMJ55_19265 [Belnapia sp. T6]|uniref:Uncharacterized protein n=1 Tax=Belnapia mucosa TaxID=2804532 RepID=A0ABS1V8K4_9PROT|nr:hypothetical protein [Belnapia mucosa]MBL6457476.1 hypothetical protein [Belnapia mucosa]